MSATATFVPASSQCMSALRRANEVRIARAELKRRVACGEVAVTEVLLRCPWEAHSMTVSELLMSQHRWGVSRCRRFLAPLPISESKSVGSMTERQRHELAELLTRNRRSAGVRH
jgi:hypothetical protein